MASDRFNKEHYSFLRFKRDPEIFKTFLMSNDCHELRETENFLILGNPSGRVTISAFLSLYCDPCSKAFNDLASLIRNCTDVRVIIIFAVYGDIDTHKIINTLYYLQAVESGTATTDFLTRWYSTPKPQRKKLYGDLIIPEEFHHAGKIGEVNLRKFEEYKIAGTPTIFINGYRFPMQYEYSDIEYYLDDIVKLTKERKERETLLDYTEPLPARPFPIKKKGGLSAKKMV